MNQPTCRIVIVVFCASLVALDAAAQAGRAPADRTLSPFFLVEGGDPSIDRLPLKETRVDVAIAGVIADVTVRQVYENRGGRSIHARYVFPASTRAAVYGMTMTVGEVRIVARIREREKAKTEFEAAKREGKSASLLEQSRPNVFTMNVANVLPGDAIEVALAYTELLVPTEGLYEFVYPTVVGPRYSEKRQSQASPEDEFVRTPYTRQGEPPRSEFHLSMRVSYPNTADRMRRHALKGVGASGEVRHHQAAARAVVRQPGGEQKASRYGVAHRRFVVPAS